MSWQKKVYSHIHNREDKFDYIQWLRDEDEDCSNWDDWLWFRELEHYDSWGAPKSLEELAQYRLLTLLRKLRIRSAKKLADQIDGY
jgi:hypothetical protein